MLAHLKGIVLAKIKGSIVLEVSGVGYRVHVTPDIFQSVEEGVMLSLWTHLVIRENAHELYGFSTQEELSLFEQVIGVSGIGPKSGLAILSLAPVATLASAIASGDTTYLTKVSGIGKKNAEKIVLDLRDKVSGGDRSTDKSRRDAEDALAALVTLGYGERESREVLKKIEDSVTDTGERVKRALSLLGTHHD